MSEKITVVYCCDICDTFLADSSLPNACTKVKLTIVEEQEWATNVLEAKHLCPDCKHEVLSFMEEMRKRK